MSDLAAHSRRLVIALLVFFSALPAAAELTDSWDENLVGVRHLHRRGIDDRGIRQNIHVVVVDLAAHDVDIGMAINHDTWRGDKETVSSMAERHGAQIAINGDYWSWGWNDPSQGTTAVDGTCYRAHPERSAIAFSSGMDRVEIGRYGTWPIAEQPEDDCPEWVFQAIGAGPQFLYDGVLRWDTWANQDPSMVDINDDTFFGPEAWAWGDEPDPNSAIGISADGRTLVLATCDGRGAGGAGGCRMAHEMADLMLEFGVDDALKLDSGGSTTLYYDGRVANVPSEGQERAVVDALLVFAPLTGCAAALDGGETSVDDGAGCFARAGGAWWSEPIGNGNSSFWTWAFEGAKPDSWGRWSFSVPRPGPYRIEAFLPDIGALSSRAPYVVVANGLEARIIIDQDGARGRWVDLGTFDFGAVGDHVRLEDNTQDPFLGVNDPSSRRLVFDALRFTYVDPSVDAGPWADAGQDDGGRERDSDDGGTTDMPDSGPEAGATRPDAGAAGDSSGCACRTSDESAPASSWPCLLMLFFLRRPR